MICNHLDFLANLHTLPFLISQTCLCFDWNQAEQDLANPAAALTAASSYDELMRLLRVPGVADKDRVRLVMLYTLRFEGDAARVRQLMEFLITAGVRDRYSGVGKARGGKRTGPV